MPRQITVWGRSIYPLWLETNIGEVYLSHEVQVGLNGFFHLAYVGKAGLDWDAYSVINFVKSEDIL